ncbi:MAG TPA: hypothetical protein VKZ82_13160 [Nonomuraea sp.]|nr:hypothetical protein [Nonomuraea sp.]
MTTDPDPLPQREAAERCTMVDADRRCVLPAAHPGAHVFPPVDPARQA